MNQNLLAAAIGACILAASPGMVGAQSADDANKSNNPLTPAPSFNLQDYYSPELFGIASTPTTCSCEGPFVPVPQFIRATIPIGTRPDPEGGYTTGIGDINLFDIFLLKTKGTQLGVGPLVTFPSANEDELGTGKWQAACGSAAFASTRRVNPI